jgi:hypothetical protein
MTTQTEAERLAVVLMRHDVGRQLVIRQQAAAELRRLVSLNNQLMDEVARLQKREWVGLTEQQVFEFIEANTEWKPAAGLWRLNEVEFARAIEAKLREKNQ